MPVSKINAHAKEHRPRGDSRRKIAFSTFVLIEPGLLFGRIDVLVNNAGYEYVALRSASDDHYPRGNSIMTKERSSLHSPSGSGASLRGRVQIWQLL